MERAILYQSIHGILYSIATGTTVTMEHIKMAMNHNKTDELTILIQYANLTEDEKAEIIHKMIISDDIKNFQVMLTKLTEENIDYNTFLIHAIENHSLEIVKLIFENKKDKLKVSKEDSKMLLQSSLQGIHDQYISAKDQWQTMKGFHTNNQNHRKHIDILKLLLSNGLDCNVYIKGPYSDQTTPLIYAIENYNYDMFNILLEYGADINLTSPDGKTTPLTAAINEDNLIAFNKLLDQCANTNIAINGLKNLLQYALQLKLVDGHDNIDQYILTLLEQDLEADFCMQNKTGDLEEGAHILPVYALMNHNITVFSMLLKRCARIDGIASIRNDHPRLEEIAQKKNLNIFDALSIKSDFLAITNIEKAMMLGELIFHVAEKADKEEIKFVKDNMHKISHDVLEETKNYLTETHDIKSNQKTLLSLATEQAINSNNTEKLKESTHYKKVPIDVILGISYSAPQSGISPDSIEPAAQNINQPQ